MIHSPPLLQVSHLGIAYGDRTVLRDVNFSIAGFGCTVLLGPSGTGKSTLLRTLAGHAKSSPWLRMQGTISYRGKPCEAPNQPALVMQNAKLLVSNVQENLVGEMPQRREWTQLMQTEYLTKVLREFGWQDLMPCLQKKAVDLPVDTQRGIAILRQFLSGSPLLMLDEPVAGLAPESVPRILDLIRIISVSRSTLVVMHHLGQTRELADRVILLANGVIEANQTCTAFFDTPQGESAKAFVTTGSCPERAYEDIAFSPVQEMHEEPPEQAIVALRNTRPVASAASGPRGFLWMFPGALAGTPLPGVIYPVEYDLEALRCVGITRLVSLTEEPFDASKAKLYGIACHASPIDDMCAPTPAQALELCQAIDAFLLAGDVVAVHCHAGLGRTGTILAAYWLWSERGQKTALEAIEAARRIESKWIQSSAQVEFLEDFATLVANRNLQHSAANYAAATGDDVVAKLVFAS